MLPWPPVRAQPDTIPAPPFPRDLTWINVAPLLLGDEMARGVVRGRVVDSLTGGKRWRLVRLRRCEQDVELMYRRAGVIGG